MDSAAIIAPLRRMTNGAAVRLLDVGSGGGLPGVVIAIACPEIAVDCLDAVAKKAAFVQQVAVTLRLPNLRGLHSRVEEVRGEYEVVSSRAFATLADFVSLSSAALGSEGVWMAMKGKYPAAELADLPSNVAMFHVEQLEVPGLDAERCLIWLRRSPA
jgi:16S rRNA (guanine527-N7)-methyltransferase